MGETELFNNSLIFNFQLSRYFDVTYKRRQLKITNTIFLPFKLCGLLWTVNEDGIVVKQKPVLIIGT